MNIDKKLATEIAHDLFDFASELREKNQDNDPEGRNVVLGATMFMGLVLSALQNEEDRKLMCDAAMGYSFMASEILGGYKQ